MDPWDTGRRTEPGVRRQRRGCQRDLVICMQKGGGPTSCTVPPEGAGGKTVNGAEAPPGMHVSPVGRKAEALRVGLEAGPGPSGVVGDRDREPKLLKLGTLEFSRNCHRSGTSGRNPAQPLPTAGPELEEELAGDPAEPPPPPQVRSSVQGELVGVAMRGWGGCRPLSLRSAVVLQEHSDA